MAAVFGVLVAAGRGTRIGFKKQFAVLADKPVWAWSAERLAAGGINRIWLVVPAEDVNHASAQAAELGLAGRIGIVQGGATRPASVYAGVRAAMSDWAGRPEELWIAVHDAVRPFVSPDDVRRTVEAAVKAGAAILGQLCADTLKRVNADGHIVETIPRDGVWQAQTPQVFRADLLMQALESSRLEAVVTDESVLFERMGVAPRMVAATAVNFKITTPADFDLARRLATSWEAQDGAHRNRF
jgi:2-C-methyl-D-erythritol 4-phosphate cytidylyltransferase